jgi:hypothetical protein
MKANGIDTKPHYDLLLGSDVLTVYNSQFTITQGKEYLVQRVLRLDSTNHRYSSSCCCTPLFALQQNSYIVLVKKSLIKQQENLPEPYRIHGGKRLYPQGFPPVYDVPPLSYTLELNKKWNFGWQYSSPIPVTFEEPYVADQQLPKPSLRPKVVDVPLVYTK